MASVGKIILYGSLALLAINSFLFEEDTPVIIRDQCQTSNWSNWSDCIDNQKTRTRTVLNPNTAVNCPILKQVEYCSHDKDCAVSAWGVWGSCDCSTGEKYRLRTMVSPPSGRGKKCPVLIDIQSCDCGYRDLGNVDWIKTRGGKPLWNGSESSEACKNACTNFSEEYEGKIVKCGGWAWSASKKECIGCVNDTCFVSNPNNGSYRGWVSTS